MEENLIWLFIGLSFSILLVLPVALERRHREHVFRLKEALAESRKNESVATVCLGFEKRNREHAEALAKLCREELSRDEKLVSALRVFAAELRETGQSRHLEALSVLRSILAKSDFVADSYLTRQTEIEACAMFGARKVLENRPDLLKNENIVLGATLGALATSRNYVNLAVLKQLDVAEERLAETEALAVEYLEPRNNVVDFRRRVRPKKRKRDEAPSPATDAPSPSSSPSPATE